MILYVGLGFLDSRRGESVQGDLSLGGANWTDEN